MALVQGVKQFALLVQVNTKEKKKNDLKSKPTWKSPLHGGKLQIPYRTSWLIQVAYGRKPIWYFHSHELIAKNG